MRNLVFVIDEKKDYARHLGVTLYSALANSSVSWNINIFHGSLSDSSREKLKKIAEDFNSSISFFKIEKDFYNNLKITEGSYLNRIVYARLAVPEILKDEKKALYLDCDLIVKKDLKEMYDTDLEDLVIGCIPDGKGDQERSKKRLDLPEELEYFNAGVMLMDLETLRENRKFQEIIKFCRETDMDLELNEQDALNIMFNNRYKRLSLIWNVTHGNQEENEFKLEDVGIIHYTGAVKPWDCRCVNPFRREYFKYLNLTPWKGYKLENNSFKNIVKRELTELKLKTRKYRYSLKNNKRELLQSFVYLLLLVMIYYLVYRQTFRSTIYYGLLGCFLIDRFYFKTQIKIEKIDKLCTFYILSLFISNGIDIDIKHIMIPTLPLILRNFSFDVREKTWMYLLASGVLVKYFNIVYIDSQKSLRMMFSSIRRYAIKDFAVYTSVLVPLLIGGILLGSYWYKKNKTLALAATLSSIGSFILLILTHQRAIVLGFIGIIIFVTLGMKNKKALYSLIGMILIGILLIFTAGDKIPVVKRFKEIKITAEGGKLTRYETYSGGIKIFLENPIKGVGLGNYAENEKIEEYFYRDGPYYHAHNIYITSLAERGVLGFLGLFMLLSVIMLKAFIGIQKNRENILISSLIIFNFIFGFFDNSLGIVPMMIIILIYILKQEASKLPVFSFL